jgi:hypothetical protein
MELQLEMYCVMGFTRTGTLDMPGTYQRSCGWYVQLLNKQNFEQ